MSVQRIPLSVRISQEDADFISEVRIGDANTPSEKIRELLKQARLAHTQEQDYAGALASVERFLQAAKHHVLQAEQAHGVHSSVLARLFELLPDLLATLIADADADADKQALQVYEEKVMRRIVRLTDAVLQLAVIGKGAAYDDNVLKHLDNTLQLAQVVAQRQAA